MTTFAELQALTIQQTRKPELADLTVQAVRNATLRAHHVDFFPLDLAEGSLSYTPSSLALHYSIPNLSTALPRYRSIKGMLGLEAAMGTPVEEFEYRELDDLYDKDGIRRTSVYSLVGDTLRVVPARATGYLNCYYYANPVLTESGFSSWIADRYPEQLAMLAATIIWNRTGFREMAKNVEETENREFRAMLVSSHLLGEVN